MGSFTGINLYPSDHCINRFYSSTIQPHSGIDSTDPGLFSPLTRVCPCPSSTLHFCLWYYEGVRLLVVFDAVSGSSAFTLRLGSGGEFLGPAGYGGNVPEHLRP